MSVFLGQFQKQTKRCKNLSITNKLAIYYVLEMIHSESYCHLSHSYAHNYSIPHTFIRLDNCSHFFN